MGMAPISFTLVQAERLRQVRIRGELDRLSTIFKTALNKGLFVVPLGFWLQSYLVFKVQYYCP